MRINYTMLSTQLTGGNRVILEVANGLVKKGHDVTLTTLGSSGELKWIDMKAKTNFSGLSLFTKTYRKKYRNLFLNVYSNFESFVMKRLANSIPECDINVATFCFTAFAVFRSGKGIPFYHMQHYEPLFYNDPYIKKLAEETYYLPLNRIANSKWLKRQLKEQLGIIDDIPIVNPAIDHEIFRPYDDVKKNSMKKRVVSLGKAVRYKGFPEALDAMKIVMREYKDVEFVVFGTEELPYKDVNVPYSFVKSPINEGLARLYCSADVVLCSSWHESFPLPPLEAMACGIPVVTTRYGTEDYAVDGVNAVVVEPKNAEALAEGILKILRDKDYARMLSENALKTAQQFTWEKTIEKVESLFKKAYNA